MKGPIFMRILLVITILLGCYITAFAQVKEPDNCFPKKQVLDKLYAEKYNIFATATLGENKIPVITYKNHENVFVVIFRFQDKLCVLGELQDFKIVETV